MESELQFRGKKITARDRKALERIFGEKIDDLVLCQAILVASMRPANVLARAAFTRALTHGYCAYADGGREAKRLIRAVRRRLGYRLTGAERLHRLTRSATGLCRAIVERGEVGRHIHEVLSSLYSFLLWD